MLHGIYCEVSLIEVSYSLPAPIQVTSGAVAEIQPMVSPLKGDYEMEAESFTAQACVPVYKLVVRITDHFQ